MRVVRIDQLISVEVVDRLLDILLLVSPDGRILDANAAALECYGYEHAELVGLRVQDVRAEGHSVVEAQLKQAFDSGAHFATRHRHRDGSEFPVEVRSACVTVDGEDALLSIVVDVTQARRDEALQAARVRIAEYASTHSLDETIQNTLDEAETLTESAIGFFHFVDEDQESLLLQTWSTNTLATECSAKGKGSHYPVREAGVWADCLRLRRPVVHNDYESLPDKRGLPAGHAAVVRELTVPVLRDGKVKVIVGVGNKSTDYDAQDEATILLLAELALEIVQAKRAEQELRESEERYRSLVSALCEGVILQAADGQILTFNAAATELFGIGAKEAIGQTSGSRDWGIYGADGNALPPEQHPSMVTLRTGEPCDAVVLEARGPRGVRAIEVNTRPLFHLSEEAPYAVVVSFADVTERKRSDERLLAAQQELERSNKELEQFAYVASHDLQEPLRMVTGYLKLISKRYKGQLDSDADEFIAFAVDGATRMYALLEDLLAYSRVGTHGKPARPVDSRSSAEIAVANLGAQLREADGEVALGDLPMVMADELQLMRLFQNLIGNGIKFRRKGQPPRIVVDAERADGFWQFSVKDNGIGIDSAHFEQVFEVFRRLAPAEDYPGTGIGLAICRRIVERLGGRIWVESSGDTGTTLCFTLPAVSEV
jgi:PAS domain S-box-containing protein